MEQRVVSSLERKIEKAIAETIMDMGLKRLPQLPSQRTMHLMAIKPFSVWDFHTFTGQLALWLMLIHASWATYVIRKGSEKIRTTFHRYSLFVWLVWLIPYFGGMYVSMS